MEGGGNLGVSGTEPDYWHVQKTDPFNVRIMPKVIFGAHPLGYDGLAGDDPGIVVLHHFLGSWKMRSMGIKKHKEGLKIWLNNLFFPQPEQ